MTYSTSRGVYENNSSDRGNYKSFKYDYEERKKETNTYYETNNDDFYNPKHSSHGHGDTNKSKNTEPIKKDCYQISSTTSQRSQNEVDEFLEINEITVSGRDVPRPVQSFKELHVPEFVMDPIRQNKFEKPTPIQAQSWPIALSGCDMVGVAQTGSGKTCAFILPAIVHIKSQSASHGNSQNRRAVTPTVLVMCPTRELCQQISEVAYEFVECANLKVVSVYGGASKGYQLGQLRRGADIIVATPGRLLDFLKSRDISMEKVSYLVLDEADRMLDMGFEPQIKQVIAETRSDRQTLMFSATWPKEVYKLANEFLKDYIKVNIGAQDLHANHKIAQHIHLIKEADKEEELVKLLDGIMHEKENKTIIFVETKRGAERLAKCLWHQKFPVIAIHGDKKQFERDRALSDFKSGRHPVMIATDVASRGIDIRDIRYVINFDYAQSSEDYIHRIGRTARSTATGVAHTFFTPQNNNKARDLVKVLEEAGQHVPSKLKEMSNYPQKGGNRYHGVSRGYQGRPRAMGNSGMHKKF